SAATEKACIRARLVQHNGKDYGRHRFTRRSRTRVGSRPAVKLLLDTHIFLWSLLEPPRLTERVAAELENPLNELWLSPIVIWEGIMLAVRVRVTLEPDATTWVRRTSLAVPLKVVTVELKVAIKCRTF